MSIVSMREKGQKKQAHSSDNIIIFSHIHHHYVIVWERHDFELGTDIVYLLHLSR